MARGGGDEKKRTRGHIIADLSVNHVEKWALLCGFTTQRVESDYGIDLFLSTFTQAGDPEIGEIRLQLKATERLKVLARGNCAILRVSKRDLQLWLQELMPVILVLYDASSDKAYWLYVQEHWARLPGFNLAKAKPTMTVRIPLANTLDQAAMWKFVEYRNRILGQIKGIKHHD